MEDIRIPSVFDDAAEVVLDAGQTVFSYGQAPAGCLVVIEGSVRVFANSPEGKEVVLYHVRPGEICTLTIACLLGRSDYQAESVTEVPTRARLMSPPVFHRLLNESESFREFVFKGFSARLADIMARYGALVLDSLHDRLAAFLVSQAGEDGLVRMTHEMLAAELGSAREVISRNLKSMERKGLIELGRGSIRLLRPEALCTCR